MARKKKKYNKNFNNIYKIILYIILALSLAVRIGYMIEYSSKPESKVLLDFSDSSGFDKFARQIVDGKFFGDVKNFYYNPGYSYFLGLIYYFFGKNFTAVRIIQVILSFITVILIYILSIKITNNKIISLLSAFFTGLYGPVIFYSNTILIAGLVPFLYALLILWIYYIPEKQKMVFYAAGGILTGYIIVVRANLILFIPFIVYYIFRNHKIRNTIVYIFFLVLPVLPFTLHNYMASDDFVLVSSNAGINFFIGNNEEASGVFSRPEIMKKYQKELKMRKIEKPSAVSKFWFNKSLDFMRNNPVSYLKLLFKKFMLFWWGKEIPNNENYEYSSERSFFLKYTVLKFNLIGPLIFTGLIFFWQASKKFLMIYLFSLYYIFITVIFLVLSRYRTPVVPVLTVFAGYSVYMLYDSFIKRKIKQLIILIIIISGSAVIFNSLKFDISTGESEQSLINRALAFERTGDLGKAFSLYNKALQKNPGYYLARYNMGTILYKLGRIDEAIKEFKTAVKIDGTKTGALFGLTKCYSDKKDLNQALIYCEKAVENGLQEPAKINELGKLYAMTGRLQEAKKVWEDMIKKYPDYKPAYQNLNKVIGMIEDR